MVIDILYLTLQIINKILMNDELDVILNIDHPNLINELTIKNKNGKATISHSVELVACSTDPWLFFTSHKPQFMHVILIVHSTEGG